MMKIAAIVSVAAALAVSGCNRNPSDKLADRVENAADARADNIETQADALKAQASSLDNRAEQIRKTGDQRADAIRSADMNVAAMSQEQRDAIVANQAPAVR